MNTPQKTHFLKGAILFLFLSLLFSIAIFLLKNLYFDYDVTMNEIIEEKYIEPELGDTEYPKFQLPKEEIPKDEKISEKIIGKTDKKVKFSYVPNSYRDNTNLATYKDIFNTFVQYKTLKEKFLFVEMILYKDKNYTRGKLKKGKIYMFDVLSLPRTEFLAVSIHEFGHFLDLYILRKEVYTDLSEYFYALSWNATKVLKKNQRESDFVSGYAMTNKYEDFAETFTYYVLHNKDFLVKTKKSEVLKKKYDFFANYIFRKGEFTQFDDAKIEKTKDYYWDTTKIDYDLYDFLRYLEHGK